MTPQEHRQAILRKHARIGPKGGFSLCNAERGAHPGGKVIFRTQADAERATAELAEWANALTQRVYKCPHGEHFHMTKKPERGAA